MFVTILDRGPQLAIPPPVVAGRPAVAKQEAKNVVPKEQGLHAPRVPRWKRVRRPPPELGYRRKKTGISLRARHGARSLLEWAALKAWSSSRHSPDGKSRIEQVLTPRGKALFPVHGLVVTARWPL